MSECLVCGFWTPPEPETGYNADSVCPSCERLMDEVQETAADFQRLMREIDDERQREVE